jgi:putative lipoic acid-binding regulatory protein
MENMILGNDGKRPNIYYPCDWDYRIIGDNVEDMLEAVKEATSGLDYELKPSNVSKSGKYFSFNLRLKVLSEDERDAIFRNLDGHENIIMVI